MINLVAISFVNDIGKHESKKIGTLVKILVRYVILEFWYSCFERVEFHSASNGYVIVVRSTNVFRIPVRCLVVNG